MSSACEAIAATMKEATRVIIKLRTQLSRVESRLEEIESELLESGNYFRCDVCKRVQKESCVDFGNDADVCLSCADRRVWGSPVEGHD